VGDMEGLKPDPGISGDRKTWSRTETLVPGRILDLLIRERQICSRYMVLLGSRLSKVLDDFGFVLHGVQGQGHPNTAIAAALPSPSTTQWHHGRTRYHRPGWVKGQPPVAPVITGRSAGSGPEGNSG
jgi:hypothetical protein